MIHLLRNRLFIKAERTGNWDLHLRIPQDMLPYYMLPQDTICTQSTDIHTALAEDTLYLQEHHSQIYALFSSITTMLFVTATYSGMDFRQTHLLSKC